LNLIYSLILTELLTRVFKISICSKDGYNSLKGNMFSRYLLIDNLKIVTETI